MRELQYERATVLANAITCIRIFCAAGLIFCPAFSAWFYTLYLTGGISDVLDGIAARHLGKESRSGARLDTIADIVFTAAVIIKLVPAVDIPAWIILWILCIAAIKCAGIISGFVIHKRFLPEHTVMNKVCGALLFALPLCIGALPRKAAVCLMILTCAAANAAAIQEVYYIHIGKEAG